jgi:hypothetical protein
VATFRFGLFVFLLNLIAYQSTHCFVVVAVCLFACVISRTNEMDKTHLPISNVSLAHMAVLRDLKIEQNKNRMFSLKIAFVHQHKKKSDALVGRV